MLDNVALRYKLKKSWRTAHGEAAAHLQLAYELSEWWARRVPDVDRTSLQYQATRVPDTELCKRLEASAQERRRFGYWRLHVLLRREGHAVICKHVERLYPEEKLAALSPNQRRSLDFVSDQMTNGQRFRILTVVDNLTREYLALVGETSISGSGVARELDRLVQLRGRPQDHHQRQRHGADLERYSELGGRDRRRLALNCAGKPKQNDQSESFNGRLRDEFLNETLVHSLRHARTGPEDRRRDYNTTAKSDHTRIWDGWSLEPTPTPSPEARPSSTRLRSRPASRYGCTINGGHVLTKNETSGDNIRLTSYRKTIFIESEARLGRRCSLPLYRRHENVGH